MLLLGILALVVWSIGLGPALAQSAPPVPPVHSAIDANGVDLVTGIFSPTPQELTIGQPGSGGLTVGRRFLGPQSFGLIAWSWSFDAIMPAGGAGAPATVNIGTGTEMFTVSGSAYTSASGSGNTLSLNTTTNVYTYTTRDGTIYTFQALEAETAPTPGPLPIWYATSVVRPNGEVDTYNYTTASVTLAGTTYTLARLQSITDNYGYQLQIGYSTDTLSSTSVLAWTTKTFTRGLNNASVYCAPTASPSSCTGLGSTPWPNTTYTVPADSATQTVTDTLSRNTYYTYDASGNITSIEQPSGLTETLTYNGSNQVASVSNGTGTWTYAYSLVSGVNTTTVTDPLSHTRVVVGNALADLVTSDTDGLSHTTSYTYDSFGRVLTVTNPEGDQVQLAYDSQTAGVTRGNVVTVTRVAKSGSGLSNIVTSASFDSSCTYPVKCNQPNSTTDANSNVTSYTYDTTYGVPLTVTPPAPTSGAVQPQTRFSYTSLYAYYKNSGGTIVAAPTPVYLNTGISQCQTEAAGTCPGTSDEAKTTIAYGTTSVANNLLPTSVSKGAGDGSLTATSSITYDPIGNPAATVGPLGSAQTTVYLFDADREPTGVIGPDPDGAGPLHFPATRITYGSPAGLDGLPTEIERGSETSQSDTNWSSFTSLNQQTITYDGIDRKIETAFAGGGTTWNVTQYSYDNANRLTCSAERMNPSVFGSLPSSACTLGTTGSNGADRIASNTYDAANRLTQVTTAYGTATQANYATTTYSNNGRTKTVLDAKNNLTSYTYDGFDRLSQVNFPVAIQGANASNFFDHENYTYDANSNLMSVRRRSGDSDTILFCYDALNRQIRKDIPPNTSTNCALTSLTGATFSAYDLLNRLTYAHYGSGTGAGVDYTYDALGRELTEAASGRTLTSQYDLAGDRTQLTWPDSFYVKYVYDTLQRVTAVEENGATSGIGLLGQYAYDDLGRPTTMTGGNGTGTTYGFDNGNRLTSLAQSFVGTSNNVTWSFSLNSADQILGRSATNDNYTSHPGTQSPNYAANGLNQYASISATSFTYDGRGNLTSDGTRTFTYDIENRLLTGSAPTAVTLTYDPVDRLQTSTASSATTTFLYDGSSLVGEYNSSGTVLRRYVSLPGMDQPLLWAFEALWHIDPAMACHRQPGFGNGLLGCLGPRRRAIRLWSLRRTGLNQRLGGFTLSIHRADHDPRGPNLLL